MTLHRCDRVVVKAEPSRSALNAHCVELAQDIGSLLSARARAAEPEEGEKTVQTAGAF